MKKRTISTIILLSMLASSVSCGGTSGEVKDSSDTDSDAVTSYEEVTTEDPRYAIKENLPEVDYGGYEFRILVRWPDLWCADMYSESLTGEVVNDAVYNRNQQGFRALRREFHTDKVVRQRRVYRRYESYPRR